MGWKDDLTKLDKWRSEHRSTQDRINAGDIRVENPWKDAPGCPRCRKPEHVYLWDKPNLWVCSPCQFVFTVRP